MELKDVILSTLAEMEEDTPLENVEDLQNLNSEEDMESNSYANDNSALKENSISSSKDSELIYLNSIRERLLVLFEGFQAPNNNNLEAKIDMTLNFLEYTLATIDERVEKLERGSL